MTARLYWFAISHPAQATRKMLDLKGIEYETVDVLPGTQRAHLRLAGFRGGTVPALKIDGRRIQGSREIARALDAMRAEPPLYPNDPELRARVEEAERWGDEELQDLPRRMLRWGLVQHQWLRRWLGEGANMPAPGVAARLTWGAAWYYARAIGATKAAARRDVKALPGMLDHADELLADGTMVVDPPNAAALQILCTVRALDRFADLHEHVDAHACASPARELFPRWPGEVPRFLPAEWLGDLARTPAA